MMSVRNGDFPSRRVPGERGSTLVEALVGLSMLGVVLLGVAGLFVASTREIRTGGEDSLLASAAEAQMEILMKRPFGQVQNGGSLSDPVADYFRVLDPGNGRRVLLMWEIQAASPGGMKQIQVRAVPMQGQGLTQGGPRDVLIQTYRTDMPDLVS